MLDLLSMRPRRALRPLVLALALAGAEPALAAAVDLLDLSIEELADLRVTSVSRVEERLSDAPAAVFVITRDELRRSGVTTHRRSAAARAGRRGRAPQRALVVDHDPRLQQRPRQQAAGADRRPQRLLAALRRRLLGRAGHAARGHRAHRGHRRSRRHAVGRQRRQRRHQHHHALGDRNRRRVLRGRRRQRGSRLRRACATAAPSTTASRHAPT